MGAHCSAPTPAGLLIHPTAVSHLLLPLHQLVVPLLSEPQFSHL